MAKRKKRSSKKKAADKAQLKAQHILELRFGAENSKDKDKSHKAVDVFLKGIRGDGRPGTKRNSK